MCRPKQMNTYYTNERIKNARANIGKYDWALRLRDDAVREADGYLSHDLEFWWKCVTPQTLPRGIRAHMVLGSPISGDRFLKEYGTYGWQGDPMKEPWKLTDPSSGYQFPTNDFNSYYESGLDEHGIFRRESADPQYLVNVLYPEKGERWGVDDGYGWIDEEGNKWTFIAFYNHWFLWYGRGVIPKALDAFRRAYLYSGELKYAQAGIILLDRIADVYPDMDSSVYKWEDGYANSHGNTGKGKAVGCIWEAGLVSGFLAAYDAFFPAMEEADIVGFLSAKAARFRLENPKTTVELVRKNIETGIVQQVFPAIKRGQIRGNFGMHQKTLALAAIVQNDPKAAAEWIEWILQSGGTENEPEHRVTGGNVLSTLVDEVDRDGFGNEASPTYNTIWLDQSKAVVEILEHFGPEKEANLYDHVKFKKFFDSRFPLTMIRSYTPSIGDTGKCGSPFLLGHLDEYLLAFEKYNEPVYAQYAYFLNGNKLEGIHGDIFSDNPGKITEDIRQVIELQGPMRFPSVNLTGYGFAALRNGEDPDGEDEALRGLWMYYGRNTGHGHRDTLNIGLHAFGLDLLPDNGYPETADSAPKRLEWVQNTISHNTVVVDESKQWNSWVGLPHHYDGSHKIRLIDVEAPKAYPVTSLYRRTAACIRVDEVDSYVVDFFRVKGGRDHHYSFHAAAGEVSVEGLSLVKQGQGTYAGADVEYGGKAAELTRDYRGSGFHHLYHVERDTAPGDSFSVDWTIRDTWGVHGGLNPDVHLRLTMLGEWNDVALADGQPPQVPGNPETLKYVIVHRNGDRLESQFQAVIEPYKGERFIESIESVSLTVDGQPVTNTDAAAVKVVLRSGRTDYIVNSINTETRYTVDNKFDFQGFYGVYSEAGGTFLYGYLHDGSMLGQFGGTEKAESGRRIQGTVVHFTKEISRSNKLWVNIDSEADAGILEGQWIYIDNDGRRNAVYEIKAARKLEATRWEVEIGDSTLIRQYKNPNDFSEGYVYDLEEGARFYIPLTREFS